MEGVDSDFGPVRKSKLKVNPDRIIQDVSVDHEQNSLLKKITLLPIKRSVSGNSKNSIQRNEEDVDSVISTKEASILSNIRLITKKSRFNALNDNDLSFKVEPLDPDFKRFKHYLLRHLYQTLPPEQTKPYSYLRETQQEINRHLKQSIVQKESHSSILVGSRRSYKTFLLNHELALLSEKFHQQFITIRLNGFIHSEQTAINGIATQLEQQLQTLHGKFKEMKKEDTNISSGSLTEVFEKILRLLDSAAVSSSQNKNNDTTKITVVFIFDEIDTFAGPVRQTLLYNLFDMVEHARVPVCILGCTTKLNILEYLEKRVKSRFSQRIIYMPQIEDFPQYLFTVKEMLSPPASSELNFVDSWNALVDQELSDANSNIHRVIRINYETFRSLPHLRNGLIPLIFGAKDYKALEESFKSCGRLKMYNENMLQSSLTAKVQSLSNLELCILICVARTTLKTKDETTNFNLVYAEYEEMIKSVNKRIPTVATTRSNNDSTSVVFDNTIKIWKKKDIKNVWESLLALNFLTEKSAVGLRESAIAAFYASNYQFQGTTIPFDLRRYQSQITLKGLRRIVPKSSMYYSWTQL